MIYGGFYVNILLILKFIQLSLYICILYIYGIDIYRITHINRMMQKSTLLKTIIKLLTMSTDTEYVCVDVCVDNILYIVIE